MRKLRSDARWHTFTAEQQKRIEDWLFTEHLSYAQTHARMREELGITCALSTIGPMYRHLKESRSNEREAILQKLTEVITEPGADIDGIRAGSLAVISKRLLDRAMAGDNTEEIVALGRVMLRGEAREIQRGRMDLARESLALRRWQASRMCGGPVRNRETEETNKSKGMGPNLQPWMGPDKHG